MFLGYNTNGLAHHSLAQAIGLLADLGYRGVGITLDHYALPPDATSLDRQLLDVRLQLRAAGMRSVIETGARYLLDAQVKHEPTLMTADKEGRRRRIAFYRHAIRCAAELESDCVSIWSGVLRDVVPHDAEKGDWLRVEADYSAVNQTAARCLSPLSETAMQRLVDGLGEVLDDAARAGVLVAFEPEPGMFIDTLAAYEELRRHIDHPNLRLTVDVGHLHCQGETPIAEYIRRFASELVNVHIEDMRAGVHEHLMFGEGEIDFPPVLAALRESGYRNGVYVELSRHSHTGPAAARQSLAFLQPMIESAS